MTIHSSAVNASQFYHTQAKTSPAIKNEGVNFSDVLSATHDDGTSAKGALSDSAPAPSVSPRALQASLKPSAPKPPNYQKLMDRMLHLANRSANQMSDEMRAEISKEFEKLSEKLYSAFEQTDHYQEVVLPHLERYIDSFDISDQMSAAHAYNQISNMDTYIDSLDGISRDNNYESELQTTLDELIHMANRSANHMSPEGRAQLAKEFDAKMEEYMKMVDDADIFIPEVENIIRQYFGNHSIETQDDAAMAFNHLSNFMDYVSTYV